MKFKMGGSGGDGAGAGWIGKRYFARKDEIYETDDPVTIDEIIKSKMGVQIVDDDNSEMKLIPDYPLVESSYIEIIQEPVKEIPKTKRR